MQVSYTYKWECLVMYHPLANFEIQRYYQIEPRFNDFYEWNNLPATKHSSYCNKFWRIWYWSTKDCPAMLKIKIKHILIILVHSPKEI